MVSPFTITITALDEATAVVQKINASMNKMMAPIHKATASITEFKKSVADNAAVKGLSAVGNAAKDVAEKIAAITAPLAAVIGIGSVAGIAALATSWGKLGMQITNASSSIGIAAGQLQTLRGAAGMAGLATGAMDSSLESIGTTLQDAQFGRNQDALMMMNQLGVSVHRLKDGSVDAAQGLMDISKAIQGKSAEAQRMIANTFGVGALLPLLQKGPEAIAAYQKKYEELAGVMSGPALESAAQFEMQMSLLHASIDGLKNRIGEQLIPVLAPLIEQFSKWIASNRELIATKIGEWIQNLSMWIQQMYASFKAGEFDSTIADLKEIGSAVVSIVHAIGEMLGMLNKLNNNPGIGMLKDILSPATALMKYHSQATSWLMDQFQSPTGVQVHKNDSSSGSTYQSAPAIESQTIPDSGNRALSVKIDNLNSNPYLDKQKGAMPQDIAQLQMLGWSRAQATGIAANIQRESTGNEKIVGDHGAAYGLAQWHPPRQDDFAKWAGHDIHTSTHEEQIRFINYELREGKKKNVGAELAKVADPGAAAALISRKYEIPADANGEAALRAKIASLAYNPLADNTKNVAQQSLPAGEAFQAKIAALRTNNAALPETKNLTGAGTAGVELFSFDKAFANAQADQTPANPNMNVNDLTKTNANNQNMDVSALAKSNVGNISSTSDKQAVDQAPQQVHVNVTIGNAPPGTTATAKSDSGKMMPVRVAYSMPTTVTP